MKGGITSGVIYPKLIGKLAEKYRLKNIGGTSAGAIAAAGAAAAEFSRYTQQNNPNLGFDKLKELPVFLGEIPKGSEWPRLLSLFQPSPTLKPHFEVLLNTLHVKLKMLVVLEIAFQMVRYFPLPSLIGLAIGTLLLWSIFLGLTGHSFVALCGALAILAGWAVDTLIIRFWFRGKIEDNQDLLRTVGIWFLLGIVWTAVAAWLFSPLAPSFLVSILKVSSLTLVTLLVSFVILVATLFYFTRSLVNGLAENGFGFCSGLNADERADPKALTNWMTGYFNELAGLNETDRPLTFGDLWRGSRNQESEIPVEKDRTINFEVMTSAVSRKMPYRIPFMLKSTKYFFDPVEWERLFPQNVIDQLKINGASKRVYDPKNSNRTFYPLPDADKWPIVVAVRMSLSFPILLSAVPLYAIDQTLKSVKEVRDYNKHNEEKKPMPVSKVWFSDGGISSNMPLHFFDSFLPQHPTFAINLTDKRPDADEGNLKPSPEPGFEKWRVSLADGNDKGVERYWKPPTGSGLDGLFEFLSSIIETMQNWRDEIQFSYPGYRDRIVQISQLQEEGGVNLNMPTKTIEALGNAGENAAEQLINRFISGGGWDNHRKIRLRNLLAQLEFKLDDLDADQADAWQTFLDKNATQKPYKMSPEEKQLANETLKALVDMAMNFQKDRSVTLTKSAPLPFPDLRITPRY
ncbi:Yip1 family protein [Methylobacter tundripaludum]|uniref:Yip1 family protein n=1 Tax=Methylobacter tundripaludum TaxID=173365 RepID=UPI0004DF05D2|nr:Yip1 family protein [Methylobacter tundripaludum]